MRRATSMWPRDDRGSVVVEFAILVPVMAILLFGSFTADRMARASMKMWNAAESVGDLVAQQTYLSAAEMADFCTGASLTLAPFTGTFKASVASVTYGILGRTVDWQDTTCGNGGSIANAVALATSYTPTLLDSVIIVRATYTYTLPSSYVLPSSVTFTRTVYSRPRSGFPVIHG